MPSSNINVMSFSGFVNITRDIQGDMELVMEVNRCSLDRNTCEKYPGATIREMCRRFQEKTKFYAKFFSNFEPPLRCPLKAGNYTMNEIKLDLSVISVLPLDGYLWLVTFKILAIEPGLKKKQTAMCINTETKIVRSGIKS